MTSPSSPAGTSARVRVTGTGGSDRCRAISVIGSTEAKTRSLDEAPRVLGWGEPAVAQAKAAARVAEEVWGLAVGSPEPPGYVD
ncbi:hypothetical protein GCM10009780_03910 [Actinomadura alba]